MKRRKIKEAPIIKKEREHTHPCDVGNQPKLFKKRSQMRRKHKELTNKDMFVKPGSDNRYKRSKKKNNSMKKLMESQNMIDITHNSYKRQEKMKKFMTQIKNY